MHDRVGVVIGGVQHTDGPLQVKCWGGSDPCDPCGVDAYDCVFIKYQTKCKVSIIKVRPQHEVRHKSVSTVETTIF